MDPLLYPLLISCGYIGNVVGDIGGRTRLLSHMSLPFPCV